MEVEVARPRRDVRFFRKLVKHPRILMISGLVVFLGVWWAWWTLQLWGLPDIGDPFDVRAFQSIRIPDDRNAFLDYSVAASLLRAANAKVGKQGDRRKPADDWASSNPAWRELVIESQEALTVWRRGTDKPDAFYEHPQPINIRTLLPITQELRNLSKLGILEGSRLEAEGDMAGAWGWYRAALRSSRHSGRHGFQIERLTGAAIYREASKAVTRLASNPKVDAVLLRRMLDDVIAIDGLTVLRSDTLKLEYVVFLNELDDPDMIEDVLVSKMFPEDPEDWCQGLPISDERKKPIQAARVILGNDRKRSLRIARLLTANWLLEADKPAKDRAKIIKTEPLVYDVDLASQLGSKGLSGSELSKWVDTSLIASHFFRDFHKYDFAIERDRVLQAKLVVHLASELYRREHGQAPASPEELVGVYLKALPEGYDEKVEEQAKPKR
jgi:hypothetical protein